VWDVAAGGPTPKFADDQVWAGYMTSAWMPTRQDAAARATLALRITAPETWSVVASGRAAPPIAGPTGTRIHPFKLDRPSPPFLYAFAMGRFEEAELEVDGVKLRALGPTGADLKGALAITAPMLRFLVEHTGAPLPSAEYTQVFVHGDAAQEAAGLALIGEQALEDLRNDPTEDWVFAHELSHQWFAWLLPCRDFSDFWLNEGFATFLVAAMKQRRWGQPAYDRELSLWRKRSARVHAEARDAPVSLARQRPVTEAELQPRGITYARGALILHKLRTELGDKHFWDAMKRYVRDRADKGASSEDLRAALEASSGKELGPFFDRWVYTAAPDL
jgi:aminopeptidase N